MIWSAYRAHVWKITTNGQTERERERKKERKKDTWLSLKIKSNYSDSDLFRHWLKSQKTMVKVLRWTLPKPFQGAVTKEDIKLYADELPDDLQPGGEWVRSMDRSYPIWFTCRSSLWIGLSDCWSVYAVGEMICDWFNFTCDWISTVFMVNRLVNIRPCLVKHV